MKNFLFKIASLAENRAANWGTLRMLNDEKKKQEIIDFISKKMVPNMVQNNSPRFRSNPRFRNNPRVWS